MIATNPAPAMSPAIASPSAATYDYSAMFNSAPSNTAGLHPGGDWVMDSGATTHVTNNQGNLTSSHSPPNMNSCSIVVGNGSKMPIYSIGSTTLTNHPFHLHHVLFSPQLIKNLISVRKCTRDNSVSVQFDPYGFFVKDLATKQILMHSSSSGEVYPFYGDLNTPDGALTVSSTRDFWHSRLGQPSSASLSRLSLDLPSPCNKYSTASPICEACQLGKQPRLPFSSPSSYTISPFQLVHCDLWTSHVTSFSRHKYYLIIVDDFSHY
jgi:hypothetical protein